MKIHVKDPKRASKNVFFSRQTFTELESRRFEFFGKKNEIKTHLTFQSKLTFPSKNPRLIAQK